MEKKPIKTAFIGFKIEPELASKYKNLPIKQRKQATEAMREAIRTAVNTSSPAQHTQS